MKILQIVQTNSNTLDTTLPFLWYLKKTDPNFQITILYCVTNKKQILRKANFVNSFCLENGIQQIDLTDLINAPKWLKKSLRFFFQINNNDSYSLKESLKNPVNFILKKKYRFIGMSLRKRIENYIGNHFVDQNRIDYYIRPEVILFDLREKSRFVSRDKLFNYLYTKELPTLLLPHSPHNINPEAGIAAFDEKGEYFPKFTKYLQPFKYSKIHEIFPEREKDFIYFNYPAYDSNWIRFNKESKTSVVKKKTTCLLMIRSFHAKGKTTPDGDFFRIDYETNFNLITRIRDSFNEEVDFIIKPHPKASLPQVNELLADCELKNYKVTYDSFYELLPSVDLVIANFTTSLLLPIFYEIPTIIIEDYVLDHVAKWDVMQKMYSGLELYCKREHDLGELVNYALNKYVPQSDIDFLRLYFPDHYLEKNKEMIQGLVN